jgi:3-oxoacyl-(acyl-carrier-protein) synthase
VAPKSPDVDAFRQNLASSESWLSPFEGFGPSNFLVGVPSFDFSVYQSWIAARFPPRTYQNLLQKMDLPAQFAIGAFVQALSQNPGLETILQELGGQAHVYVGTGIGALDTTYRESIELYRIQRRWDRFWAAPERNEALRAWLGLSEEERNAVADVPPCPESVPTDDREDAENHWYRYWAARSQALEEYLAELAAIDGLELQGDIETGKLHILREKGGRYTRLQEKWGAPEPPWKASPNLLWNIHSIPAAQISMMGRITGLAFAPCAACSTFGVALRLAMDAIRSGAAKAVVVGATDPPPHPLTIGAFYSARVLSADRRISIPFTRLQGTHVAGGAAIWIVGDLEYMKARGLQPLGMEPLAVGVSADAHHIITPSADGPRAAMHQALQEAGATPASIGTWDVHATATPGDYTEITTLRSVLPDPVLITARKGTFGHGMSAGGGWELTAQYLGYEQGRLFPTPLDPKELHEAVRALHDGFVFRSGCDVPPHLAGKMSLGIGGINACVISRPWEKAAGAGM